MGKRILLGSMLVLTLLLLMPSIPAIQQKTIEEGIKQDFQEKLESINLDGLEEIEESEWKRHPILYIFVIMLRNFRWARYDMIGRVIDALYPQIFPFFLCIWLFFVLGVDALRIGFWNRVSDILGWGWNIPDMPT